jgi:hypothetical protein
MLLFPQKVRHLAAIAAAILVTGCAAPPLTAVDFPAVGTRIGADPSTISLAQSCLYAQALRGDATANFVTGSLCAVLTDRIAILRSGLQDDPALPPFVLQYKNMEGVSLVKSTFGMGRQLQFIIGGQLVAVVLLDGVTYDVKAIEAAYTAARAAGVPIFEGTFLHTPVRIPQIIPIFIK